MHSELATSPVRRSYTTLKKVQVVVYYLVPGTRYGTTTKQVPGTRYLLIGTVFYKVVPVVVVRNIIIIAFRKCCVLSMYSEPASSLANFVLLLLVLLEWY